MFKNLTSYLSYLPTKALAVFAGLMVATGLTIGAIAGFGPDRPTKPYSEGVAGFDHVTFNSFTGVPGIGDERNFFHGQILGDGVYYDPINDVRDGDEIMVRVYVHNGADESLNASGDGIAKNTKVRVELPAGSDTSHTAKAYISADNAQPKEIWDELDFDSENDAYFELEPVADSATILTNYMDKKVNLNNLLGDGVLIGDDALDGEVRGCFDFTALVTFKVKVKMPRYTLQKQVRKDGQTSADWTEQVTVKSGDTVEWGMEFVNTGATELKSVKIVDEVPANTEVISDTIKLFNGNYPSGYTYPNTAIQAGGTQVNVDIGNYNPDINAWVLFKTVVDPDNQLGCGVHTLINNAYATPDGYGAIRNDASVKVDNGECEQPEEQSLTCDLLEVNNIGENSWKFTASATAENGASITGYDFNVNGESKQNSASNTFDFATDTPGTYTVQVFVNGKVDGKDVTKTSDNCKKTVTVDEEPETPIYECKVLSINPANPKKGEKVTFTVKAKTSGDVTVNKYLYDFGDGSDVLSTDKNTAVHTYDKDGDYTAEVTVVFSVGNEQKDDVCKVNVQVKTPTKPEEPPVQPPAEVLPNTGIASVAAGFFGTGTLAYSVRSWLESRSMIKSGLLKRKQ